MSASSQVRIAYDGSAPSFRALRACGWGDLLNLGEYRWLELPLLLLRGLGHFQRRLARSSCALVEANTGERILDVACGLGWTSAHLARSGAHVTGLDALEAHVAEARETHPEGEGLRYVRGDMRALHRPESDLDFADASFDAVHCLEAGFHLGPEGRAAFLAEAWRVLRPGGRLVLVDFTWVDEHPEDIERLDPKRTVRDTWQFDEFEPLARYRRRAQDLGFALERCEDWSPRVTDRFVYVCYLLTLPGKLALGRWLMEKIYPDLRALEPEHWPWLLDLTRDHDRVRSKARYTAFVWRKPQA